MSHLHHSKQNHYNPLIDSLYKSIKPRRSPNVFLKMIPVHTAHSRGFIYIFVFIQKTNILQLLIIYNYAKKIQSFMLTTITNSNPVLWSFCYFNSGTFFISTQERCISKQLLEKIIENAMKIRQADVRFPCHRLRLANIFWPRLRRNYF